MISAFSSSALARKDERYGPSRDLTSPYSSNALRAGNVAPRVPDTAALAGLLSRGAGLPGVTPHQRIVLGLRSGHARSLAPPRFRATAWRSYTPVVKSLARAGAFSAY